MDLSGIEIILQEIQRDVSVVKEILQGNGDTDKGLVSRVTRLEERGKGAASQRRGQVAIICALIMAAASIITSIIMVIAK